MSVNWEDKLRGKKGLEQWDLVREVIKEATKNCVPMKMRKVGTKPIWMARNIIRLIRKKRRLWQAYTRPG